MVRVFEGLARLEGGGDVPWRNLLLGCSGTSRFEQLNPESKGPKRRRMKERKKGQIELSVTPRPLPSVRLLRSTPVCSVHIRMEGRRRRGGKRSSPPPSQEREEIRISLKLREPSC
jgi:hypothetical protein